MADYSNSRSAVGSVDPDNATQSQWIAVEPLVTPAQLRARHLFGVPLVSGMKDPVSGKSQVYTDDMIKDAIDRAVAMVEEETKISVFPRLHEEKHAFDRNEYASFGYFRPRHRPIANVSKLTITPSNEADIYTVPIEWLEMGNAQLGMISVIPLVSAIGYSTPAAVSAGGAVFLTVLGAQNWIPAFWKIQYTSGFPDGMVPKSVNELIGVITAIDILSSLAVTYARSNSHSLGLDGASQSISTPGPQIFAVRMEELEKKKQKLVKSIKTKWGLNIFSGNI